jgi:hypothetical protein
VNIPPNVASVNVASVRWRADASTSTAVYDSDVQLLENFGPRTIVRVEKQGELLLKVYLAERAKDPSSRATKSSRSK